MKFRYRIDKKGYFRDIGARDKSVCVRLPSGIYDTVMEYEGKNFSEKLINLIFDYKEFHDLKK